MFLALALIVHKLYYILVSSPTTSVVPFLPGTIEGYYLDFVSVSFVNYSQNVFII